MISGEITEARFTVMNLKKTAPGLKFNMPHLLAENIWIIWSPGCKYYEKVLDIPIQWSLLHYVLLRPNEITNTKTSCASIPLQHQNPHSKPLLRKSSKTRQLVPERLELINLTLKNSFIEQLETPLPATSLVNCEPNNINWKVGWFLWQCFRSWGDSIIPSAELPQF